MGGRYLPGSAQRFSSGFLFKVIDECIAYLNIKMNINKAVPLSHFNMWCFIDIMTSEGEQVGGRILVITWAEKEVPEIINCGVKRQSLCFVKGSLDLEDQASPRAVAEGKACDRFTKDSPVIFSFSEVRISQAAVRIGGNKCFFGVFYCCFSPQNDRCQGSMKSEGSF